MTHHRCHAVMHTSGFVVPVGAQIAEVGRNRHVVIGESAVQDLLENLDPVLLRQETVFLPAGHFAGLAPGAEFHVDPETLYFAH